MKNTAERGLTASAHDARSQLKGLREELKQIRAGYDGQIQQLHKLATEALAVLDSDDLDEVRETEAMLSLTEFLKSMQNV